MHPRSSSQDGTSTQSKSRKFSETTRSHKNIVVLEFRNKIGMCLYGLGKKIWKPKSPNKIKVLTLFLTLTSTEKQSDLSCDPPHTHKHTHTLEIHKLIKKINHSFKQGAQKGRRKAYIKKLLSNINMFSWSSGSTRLKVLVLEELGSWVKKQTQVTNIPFFISLKDTRVAKIWKHSRKNCQNLSPFPIWITMFEWKFFLCVFRGTQIKCRVNLTLALLTWRLMVKPKYLSQVMRVQCL